MKAMHEAASKSIVRTASWMALLGAIIAMNISFVAKASAESGDAEKLLKGMADYVASQKTLAVTYDSDIEVITSNLQKIQFTSSGQVQLSRPDKLRATRTGGYRDVEIVFDGKMLTVNNKDGKDYAQIEAAGTAEELIDVLREKHGVVAPGADLLLTNVFNVMMADVVEAAVIGKGVIDGVECDHLAFRNVETDWQIWIESGAKPIPRKYVITSKGIARSAAIHAAHQGMEDGRCGRRLRVQAGSVVQEDRARRTGRHRRSPAGHHQSRRQEMTRISTLFRLSIGDHARRRRPFLGRSIAPRRTVVAGVVRRGQNRPSADADELRRRCAADHAPGRGGRGCRGGAVAAGAYYAAPVVVAPACSQVVDAYGRVVTVCR